MDRSILIRAACLYVPLMLVALLMARRYPTRRRAAGMLTGVMWSLPALLVLQLLNLEFGWWKFHAQGGLLRGMPADLYLGWVLLWGALPTLLFPRLNLAVVIALMFGADLVAMPACAPVVELSGRWLVGEAVALLLVLLPAQLFSRWTVDDTHLSARAFLHVVCSGAIFLFLVPESIFAMTGSGNWAALAAKPGWRVGLELQLIALIAVIGVSATQEFARRGGGTPIPQDPPKRLVASGMYRYLGNPMQLSCALVLTAWGVVLEHPWVVVAGLVAVVYGIGLANWDEEEDLGERFGDAWRAYRKQVPHWRVRWRPFHDPAAPSARLYVAESCGPCVEVRRWFAARKATGLEVVAAEDHPARDLHRITYDPADGSPEEEGLAAFARGLEHLHFGWAYVGALARLPVIRPVVQTLLDSTGLGPRAVKRRCAVTEGN